MLFLKCTSTSILGELSKGSQEGLAILFRIEPRLLEWLNELDALNSDASRKDDHRILTTSSTQPVTPMQHFKDIPSYIHEPCPHSLEAKCLSELTVIGQFNNAFIVSLLHISEDEIFLIIVDQHAADERYHYESILEQTGSGMGSQKLIAPCPLKWSLKELEFVENHMDQLARAGYKVELSDTGGAYLHSCPVLLGRLSTEQGTLSILTMQI